MFEQADAEIRRILELVEACPESLRGKAFEILLQGYVSSLTNSSTQTQTQQPPAPLQPPGHLPPANEAWREGIPEEVLPRFRTMAARIKVFPEKLADVFDFAQDPFTYAAIHIEGASNRERVLRVAMLVAARGYLATGRWSADWAEIKAMCTHQNCYDVNNFSATLKSSEGDFFKKVENGNSVQTSAKGQSEAERILASLAGGVDAAKE